MELLHSAEVAANLVSGIYEAAYDPALWPAAVARLRDAFHGSKVCLGHLGPDIPSTDAVIAPDSDPSWATLYFEQFAKNDGAFLITNFGPPQVLAFQPPTLHYDVWAASISASARF